MFIPHSEAEQREMLAKIGISQLAELFESIPAELRLQTPLDLPAALSEPELERHVGKLAAKNRSADQAVCFLGGGCYDHFVPAVVDTVAGRSEFYTAYTPYQAEASQGTLQVGFEFQTLMCQLTGLDVSNASMYEGASAMVEAALMARAGGRVGNVVVADSVHPEYRQTLATYLQSLGTEVRTVANTNGLIDPEKFKAAIDGETSCAIIANPNFFGMLEAMPALVSAAKSQGAAVIQVFDPISVGLIKRPGDYGVDIAVAEGQSLGTPMSFGGPFLGIFACTEAFVRRIPGRVVGETVDRNGKRCFVLTLQTREQHIRREKATSNICTNQGLLALRASVFLSLVGPKGLKEMAELCWQNAHYAAAELAKVPGLKIRSTGTFFKEFLLETPGPAANYLPALLKEGFHAGIPVGKWYPALQNTLLVAVTEKRDREEIDGLVNAWKKVLA